MNVTRHWSGIADPYPVLFIEIDGLTAVLGLDNKLTLLEQYNAVFLGSDFKDKTYVDIPAVPEDGQAAQRLPGFTDDPEIVGIYREWLSQYR